MKTLNRFIIERLKINKNTKVIQYHYHPKDFDELRSLLEKLLEERGKDADLNDIDVSEITTFYNKDKGGLFYGLDPHNIKIDQWDVHDVENMHSMFRHCKKFNCNLSKWDVSNVKDMICMFDGCENFKGQGLENWKPKKCYNMEDMFHGCINFDCNLSNWDVWRVQFMQSMFEGCKNFTGQGLENWKTIDCRDMSYMFYDCTNLNCNLSKWDVRNVTNMNYMFWLCKKFNSNLSGWNVSNVENMDHMFCKCETFTGQGLENWKPIKVCNIAHMFYKCTSLNCNLSKWDVSNVEFMECAFEGCKNKPSWYKE